MRRKIAASAAVLVLAAVGAGWTWGDSVDGGTPTAASAYSW